jgi:hypothetical protein
MEYQTAETGLQSMASDMIENTTDNVEEEKIKETVIVSEKPSIDPKVYAQVKGVLGSGWSNFFSKDGVCLFHNNETKLLCNKKMSTSSPHSRMKHVYHYHYDENASLQNQQKLSTDRKELTPESPIKRARRSSSNFDTKHKSHGVKKEIEKPEKVHIVDSHWISLLCFTLQALQNNKETLNEQQMKNLLKQANLIPDKGSALELDSSFDEQRLKFKQDCERQLQDIQRQKLQLEHQVNREKQELQQLRTQLEMRINTTVKNVKEGNNKRKKSMMDSSSSSETETPKHQPKSNDDEKLVAPKNSVSEKSKNAKTKKEKLPKIATTVGPTTTMEEASEDQRDSRPIDDEETRRQMWGI